MRRFNYFWAISVLSFGLMALPSAFAQTYDVFLGDRDLQRGVLRFTPSNNTTSVFGSCPPAGTRFYYGMDFDPATGRLWACDVLAGRIVALDSAGNCVGSITTAAIPTGLAIHPNGRYAFVTNSSNSVSCYDLQNGTLKAILTLPNTSMLYGLDFSDTGLFLYVCDFGNPQLIQVSVSINAGTITMSEGPRVSFSPRTYQGQTYTVNPYDVAIRTASVQGLPGILVDHIYVTLTTGFQGPYSEVAYGRYRYGSSSFPEPTTFVVNPGANPNTNVSFFGIEFAPDGLLWVSQYIPGALFTVSPSTAQVVQRAFYGNDKLGLGVAIRQPCRRHIGDVDSNGCVDDADLLAVLFAFGSSGANLGRVDTNCDGIVDDADLLTVLFNFGSGC